MHPRDEVPTPVRPTIVRPSPLHNAGNVLVGVGLLCMALALLFRYFTPESIAPTASPGAMSSPQPPRMFPPEVLQMAVAVSTSLAPTPTRTPTPEPTPTYAMQSTPIPPPDVCLTSTPRGSVCTQPLPPLPSPTPMADCPVLPGELCVWRGGLVTWLTPTSTPELNMSSGLNS